MKSALKPLTEDPRDFQMEKLGGIFVAAEMPKKSFVVVEPLRIQDQGSDYTCTARTVSAILEDTERVEISPEWQWMQTAAINELDPVEMNQQGVELRQAFKVPPKAGALEQKYSPMTFAKDGAEKAIDKANYDPVLSYNALLHRQKTYFRADNRYGAKDFFDSLVLSLWQNKDFKRTLGFGLMYDPYWSDVSDGIIEKLSGNQIAGHAMKAFGYEVLASGKEYILAQNSIGAEKGNNGVFRFSREVMNSGKRFGAFMFIDLPEWAVTDLKKPSLFGKIKAFLKGLW